MSRLTRPFQRLFLIIFALTISTSIFANNLVDNSIAPMLKNVLPAVVNIKAIIKITDFNTLRELMKRRGKNQDNDNNDQDSNMDQNLPNTYVSVGSGVIINAARGYIITNAHVINDAQTITVTLGDGRHFTAKVIGSDKPSDVALLQINAKNLTAIPLADSNKLKVGDFVAAIGNPFGLNQTATSGIVSALGRTTLGIENYENFIQTDAPINPGNSGGALVNAQGELVGINTAILAPDRGSIGIGFAIPANMAKSVTMQLLEYGNVKRGVLGIGAQDITPELANAFNIGPIKGAAVAQVIAGSPAEQAGFQVDDIITAVNGTEIKNASDVVNTVGFLRVNSKININVLRHGKPIVISVTLIDPTQRKFALERLDPFLYGVGLKNFRLLSPIHGHVKGILVVSVDQDSKAWQSDLRPGDVIRSANQQPVEDIKALKEAANKAGNTLLLNVLRGPTAIFLVMNKEI